MASELDTDRCPLCGEHNHCGLSAGKGNCWCYSIGIPEGLLLRVPPELQGVACICRGCSESHSGRIVE